MQHLIAVLILFCGYCSLSAQRLDGRFILRTGEETVSFEVKTNAKGRPFLIKPSPSIFESSSLLKQLEYTLNDADLHIVTKLKKPAFNGLNYALSASITGPLGGKHELGLFPFRSVTSGSLTWEDATEQGWYPSETYDLKVKVYLLGDTDCAADRPKYELNGWRLISSTVTLAGVGILGYGQLKAAESKELYDSYLNEWEAGGSPTGTTEDTFQRAKTAQDQGQDLINVGSVITIAGGLTSIYLLLKSKKEKRMYDEYCRSGGNRFSLVPTFDDSSESPCLGLSLQYKF